MNETVTVMQQKPKTAEKIKEEQRGDGKQARHSRQLSEGSEGGEGEEKLRWRVHWLEKEKLELTTSHNQELCKLRAELTRLRSSVERGEAQRLELQYQLTVSQRNEEQVLKLTERAAGLQQTVQELQKALEITRQAREEDRHALQQDVEERDGLIQSFTSENQKLQQLLQDHKEALGESEQRMVEFKKENEKEAQVKRRLAKELQFLKERENRSVKEKEVSDQRLKSFQVSMEAERASHLETKFNSEVLQLRLGDLEAALALERSGHQVALHNLELLRVQLREVEQVYSQEREKSIGCEHHLQRLQRDFAQCKTELNVILEKEKKMTSDLTEKLEDEKRQHANTRTLLEQNQSEAEKALRNIREMLQQHSTIETSPSAKGIGDQSSADLLHLLKENLGSFQHRLEAADRQVQDLLLASEKLHEENRSLKLHSSDQSRQMKEAQQAAAKLQWQVDCLREERSDWLAQSREVQAELERNGEKSASERVEQAAKVQEMAEQLRKQSKDHLSFLYTVYQRLLTGCVLLDQPQSILGNFTWKELCDVINEHVDQLTSDLRQAHDKISHLQSVCNKKSMCVRELQRSQECVMSRLAESLRKREEAWSSQHTHTVATLQKELQACRFKCDTLRDRASSLERRNSSLTSDLTRLEGLHARSQREACSFQVACSLLAGALRHTQRRSQLLSEQKRLLSAQLDEKEALEEEVRRLAAALGGEEEDAGRSRGTSMAVRWWRRSVWAVRAIRRWRSLGRQTSVLFSVEVGGAGPAVGVCGGVAVSARLGTSSGDEGRPGVCAHWLRSKSLSSKILSSMANLQGVLSVSGSSASSSPDVMSAARSSFSLLLHHLFDQSDTAAALRLCRPEKGELVPSLSKELVSSLQRHFLLFSQRLHSAEMERRTLRQEVASLKRGGQRRHDREEMVASEHFNGVRTELRQSLSRERGAQTLLQEQSEQLRTLRRHLNTHASEQRDLQNALGRATQSLSEVRREVAQKGRSLRILGKHLMGVQRERKQLRQRLQRAEGNLSDATRRRDMLIASMKAAEISYNQVRETLLLSRSSLGSQLHPSPLQHLEKSLGECAMALPEIATCQSLLSSFSQLCHSYSSRVDWLEQEVSTLRSHVMALHSELQDVSTGDSGAFVPISEFPEKSTNMNTSLCPVPLSNSGKEHYLSLSSAPAAQTVPTSPRQKCPAASIPSKLPADKTKEMRSMKKSRGGRQTGSTSSGKK